MFGKPKIRLISSGSFFAQYKLKIYNEEHKFFTFLFYKCLKLELFFSGGVGPRLKTLAILEKKGFGETNWVGRAGRHGNGAIECCEQGGRWLD
jgi:hypothetical protein